MRQTFRLFISSTFDDFRRERELLQTQVFPEVKEYCSSKGYTFQPIDLRWGVNQEAQLDQKTLELCLNEVRACKTYPHPNFLVMLGDRYGWVPLPYAIEKQELESLLEIMPDDDKQDTLEWYKEDLNQIPVSYILKERRGEFEDHEVWQNIEKNLRNTLQQTAKKTLDEKKQRKYFLSATEAEVEEGIIPYIKPTEFQETLIAKNVQLQDIDPKYIFGFLRDIDKTSVKSERFICGDYDEANSFKQRVKKELLDENILTVKTTQIDDDSLDESYLNEFASTITAFLKQQIDNNIIQQKEVTPLEAEIEAQHYFARQKRQNFLGREKILQEIADYIEGDSNKPLVVYGRSGLGKSSLMAMAIKQAEDETDKQVCYRFVGATPNSSSSKQILISIFDQLGIDLRSYLDKEQQILLQDDKQNNFEDFSKQVYKTFVKVTEPTVIFIDAVDQLGNSDQFIWLPKALPAHVKIVISALDDKKYINDSNYFQSLKAKTENVYEILDFGEPVKLLYALLNNENRTVQKHQEEYFLRQYSSSASPLYISIAVQEMRNWKSFDSVVGDELTSDGEMQSLADTQQGIIQKYISNLSKLYHHNKAFVQRALGYIYASKDGLSESEILQLLSINEDFIKQVAPSTWHENKSCDLPVVIWTRLYTHLRPFLSLKIKDDEELLYFFHREFEDVVSQEKTLRQTMECFSKDTLNILKSQNNDFDKKFRFGKIHIKNMSLFTKKYCDYSEGIAFKHPLVNHNLIISLCHTKDRFWLKSYVDYCLNNISFFDYTKKREYIELGYVVSRYMFKNFNSLEDSYQASLRSLLGIYIDDIDFKCRVGPILFELKLVSDKCELESWEQWYNYNALLHAFREVYYHDKRESKKIESKREKLEALLIEKFYLQVAKTQYGTIIKSKLSELSQASWLSNRDRKLISYIHRFTRASNSNTEITKIILEIDGLVNSDVLQKQIDIKYFKINRLKKENNKDKELKERISLSKILEKHNYIKQYLNNLKRIIVLSKVSEKYELHVKTIEELYNYYKNEKEINYSLLFRTGNLLFETYNNCSKFYLSEPLCIELIPFFKLNCQKNKRQYKGHFLKFLENTFLLLKHQTICLDKEYFELFGNFINHCDGKKLGSSELQEKSLTKIKELYAKKPKEWEAYYIEFLENLK